MRTPTTPVRNFRSAVGKIVMALAFVSLIIGVGTGPAFGRDDRRDFQQERSGHGERDRHDERNRPRERDRREYRSYDYYSAPVYAPPPVVYAPVPSPGISLFFPFEFRFH